MPTSAGRPATSTVSTCRAPARTASAGRRARAPASTSASRRAGDRALPAALDLRVERVGFLGRLEEAVVEFHRKVGDRLNLVRELVRRDRQRSAFLLMVTEADDLHHQPV